MIDVSLSEKEFDLIKKSVNHCLKTCKDGGAKNGCTDCETLEGLLGRLSGI